MTCLLVPIYSLHFFAAIRLQIFWFLATKKLTALRMNTVYGSWQVYPEILRYGMYYPGIMYVHQYSFMWEKKTYLFACFSFSLTNLLLLCLSVKYHLLLASFCTVVCDGLCCLSFYAWSIYNTCSACMLRLVCGPCVYHMLVLYLNSRTFLEAITAGY